MSIMHYGKDYFAKLTEDQTGYLTTLEALNAKYKEKIGQRERVTSADAAKVNILYGCAGIFQRAKSAQCFNVAQR